MKTRCTIVTILVSVKNCSIALRISAHRSNKDEELIGHIASYDEALVVRYVTREVVYTERIPLTGVTYGGSSTWRYINKNYKHIVCHKGRLT